MRTVLDVGTWPRHLDAGLPNPLAQPGIVWHAATKLTLPPEPGSYPLRYSDPGGVLDLIAAEVGPPTAVCVMADNVAGVTGWQGLTAAEQYASITERAGAFPCGGMLYLRVSGPGAGRVVDRLTPRDLLRVPVGRAAFAVLTTTAGTVDTEAIVFRTAPEEYLLSVGGATRPPSWLAEVLADESDATAEEADVISFNLKGPRRAEVMQWLVHPDDRHRVARLEPFAGVAVRTAAGLPAHVLRTTIGMELWAGPEAMVAAWQAMLAAPNLVTPCGWDMVNTFRLECEAFVFAVCPLDLHAGTTLWEIGGERLALQAKDRDYVGRDALAAARTTRRLWLAGLVGPVGGAEVPPVGAEIRTPDGGFAGWVTTSAHSPRYGRPLAFAHLRPGVAVKDQVSVGGVRWTVLTPPLCDVDGLP